MAKVKTKVRYADHPKTAPDGMEFVDVKRTVGKNKDVIVKSLVPTADGAGLTQGVEYLTKILPADGPDGTVAVAEAFRDWWITSQIAQHTGLEEGEDTSKVGTTVPRVKKLNTVDKGAVVGGLVRDAINAHTGKMSQADLDKIVRDIYSGLAL